MTTKKDRLNKFIAFHSVSKICGGDIREREKNVCVYVYIQAMKNCVIQRNSLAHLQFSFLSLSHSHWNHFIQYNPLNRHRFFLISFFFYFLVYDIEDRGYLFIGDWRGYGNCREPQALNSLMFAFIYLR